jgi:hypothetical protein
MWDGGKGWVECCLARGSARWHVEIRVLSFPSWPLAEAGESGVNGRGSGAYMMSGL